jgi:hypothetical protein
MTIALTNAEKIDTIFRAVWDGLKPHGYRKLKRVCNRLQPDGSIQVIYFQMGRNWSILYGKFTVEIGIFIPEVYSALYEKNLPKFITITDCILRKRISSFKGNGADYWWDLNDDVNKTIKDIMNILLTDCEQYLTRFGSREKILDHWDQERKQKQLDYRNILIMAIMLLYSNRKEQANQILFEEFSKQRKSTFLEYARNTVVPLGLKFPELE